MTDTKQRRTTSRKLAIIQLLAEHPDGLPFRAISLHLTHATARSLYATLEGMVQEGLLVTRHTVTKVSGNHLPQRVTYWHTRGMI